MPSVAIQRFSNLSKQKIMMEAWLSAEFEFIIRTSDDAEWFLSHVFFLPVNGIVIRQPVKEQTKSTASFLAYYPEMRDNVVERIDVICSMPIFSELDNRTFIVLLKIIKNTIELYKRYGNKVDFDTCELEAIENYRKECSFGNKTQLNNFTTSQQTLALYLRVAQNQNFSLIDPKIAVDEGKRNEVQYQRLRRAFNRARIRFVDSETVAIVREMKVSMYPSLFYFTTSVTSKSHVSGIHTLMVYSKAQSYLFSIILVSEPFLEAGVSDEELEILLAYEIANLISQRHFQRGSMEKAVFSVLSSKQDIALRNISSIYTNEIVGRTKLHVQTILEGLYSTVKSIVDVKGE